MKYHSLAKTAGALMSLVLLLATSCSGDDAADGAGRLDVFATTTQIGDFATQVGGEQINLTVLLQPNQDAHDLELQPSQIRALDAADVVLINGLGLDAFMDRALESTGQHAVVVTDGTSALEGENMAGDRDPHVWFNVENAKVMVDNITQALAEADPANRQALEAKAEAYLEKLDALEAEIRQQVSQVPPACRKLVTNHDVLGHYAEAYGFEVVGAIIPATSTQARPSASRVAEIVELIRSEDVPAIFADTSVSPDLVNQVGREAGVQVVDDLYGDSLGPEGSDGATYIDMMRSNTEKIVGALRECQN